jgi:hypothetical protein
MRLNGTKTLWVLFLFFLKNLKFQEAYSVEWILKRIWTLKGRIGCAGEECTKLATTTNVWS